MLLLLGMMQTSAHTCTGSQQDPVLSLGDGFPSWLVSFNSGVPSVNSTEPKISVQRAADCQTWADLTFPSLCYNHTHATTCQTGILKLFIKAYASRKRACAPCCFPMIVPLPLWFVFVDFLIRIHPCHWFLFLLPPGWLPTCPNLSIIIRKGTPGNWQALLIENWGGNHLAQGKAPLMCHTMDHHLFAKLAEMKY